MAGPARKQVIDQGLELTKLLTLKRSGMLDTDAVVKHLDSETARRVARALVQGQPETLDDSERDLYQMVNTL